MRMELSWSICAATKTRIENRYTEIRVIVDIGAGWVTSSHPPRKPFVPNHFGGRPIGIHRRSPVALKRVFFLEAERTDI